MQTNKKKVEQYNIIVVIIIRSRGMEITCNHDNHNFL